MFRLESVTKIYERRGQQVTALEKTMLEIPDNDFIAVIGPSGSGKTTLLSVLGGMLAPTAGHVMLNGQSLYGLSVQERAKLPQTFAQAIDGQVVDLINPVNRKHRGSPAARKTNSPTRPRKQRKRTAWVSNIAIIITRTHGWNNRYQRRITV